MAESEEREDLESLVASDGWKRFEAHVRHLWDEEFSERALEAVATATTTSEEAQVALTRLRQVIAIKREVAGLLAWPQRRLQMLVEAEQRHATQSRRGGL